MVSNKRLFSDLHYFQEHLKLRKNRLAVLDGRDPCYNRLIVALSKIDNLLSSDELSRQQARDLNGWLHSSIESYPAQPHQIPRVLNHFNNSWKEPNTFVRHRKIEKPYTFSPIDNIVDCGDQQEQKAAESGTGGNSLETLQPSLNRFTEIAGLPLITPLSDKAIIESIEVFTGKLLSNATWQTLIDSTDEAWTEALEEGLVLIAYLKDQIAAKREEDKGSEKSSTEDPLRLSLLADEELSQLKGGVEFIRNALRQKKAILELTQKIDDLRVDIAILEKERGVKKEVAQLKMRLKALNETLLDYDQHPQVKDATGFGHWLSPPHSFPATLHRTRQCLSTQASPSLFDYTGYRDRRNKKLVSVHEEITELINKTPGPKEDRSQWKASSLTTITKLNEQISLELVTSLKPFEHDNKQAREEIKVIKGIQYLLMECCAALQKQHNQRTFHKLFQAIDTLMTKE